MEEKNTQNFDYSANKFKPVIVTKTNGETIHGCLVGLQKSNTVVLGVRDPQGFYFCEIAASDIEAITLVTENTNANKFIYSDMLQSCTISKKTANFISCVLSLYDLNTQVCDAIAEMYTEFQVDDLVDEFYKTVIEVESWLYEKVRFSIYENISIIGFNQI